MLDTNPNIPDWAVRARRIQVASRLLKWICTLGTVAFGVLSAGIVAALLVPSFDHFAADTSVSFEDWERPFAEIPLAQRIGLAIFLLPGAASLIAAAWAFRTLFARFEQGRFFDPATAVWLMAAGAALLVHGLHDLVSDPVRSALASWDQEEGMFLFYIDGGELFFLIFGALVLVFGWILREAASIEEENKSFV
ncbi:hypothetical protein GCM10011316_23170 [Roseibium aquae]|uniref:DUF2975 domain-containing protein n=1 Tax=Roseibium aquae TaxID=1323746 RepID=A0A916TKZ6_9HYPH|nr:DUF2975 domain-containing protein [Roseibium aquae]GGB50397.1 hypothetical protein GCM10011316_23170 [Roseibium aquae]